jgi:hypothetical protein
MHAQVVRPSSQASVADEPTGRSEPLAHEGHVTACQRRGDQRMLRLFEFDSSRGTLRHSNKRPPYGGPFL